MRLGARNDQAPPEYPLIPEEVFVAKFTEYDQPKQSDYINKRTGEYPLQIRIVFTIADPDADDQWQGEKAGAWFDLEINAELKKSIYHPLAALDPDNDPEGGEDLDDYLNKKCRIMIKHTTKGDKTYANVGSVLPYRKKKKTAADDAEAVAAPKSAPKKSAFDVDEDDEAA